MKDAARRWQRATPAGRSARIQARIAGLNAAMPAMASNTSMGIPVDALAPAEAAGVIEFGPRMRFHHP